MKAGLLYWGLRACVGLVGRLPAPVARGLGRLFGRVWCWLDHRRREMSRRHMTRVLGGEAGAEEAARRVMESYGRYFAEALWVRADKAPAILAKTEVEGLDLVESARDAGGGMVFALPHLGNWEAAAPVAVNVGVPVVAVAERLANKRVTDWFTSMRAELGIEVVLATGRLEVMRRLEQAIAANKAVALLADRDISGGGVEVEFFGERTTIPAGPATLALKTGAPLLPVGAYFKGDGHRVVVRPPIAVAESGSRSERVRATSQVLAAELEKLIGEAPDQWHILQPNWPSDEG